MGKSPGGGDRAAPSPRPPEAPNPRDPSEPGPLGASFAPGAHDPEGHFSPKERAIAERLARDGACVHPRVADHTRHGHSNPDAIVRWSPTDGGTVTEFKTLAPSSDATDATVKANISKAAKQLGKREIVGDVVIDARATTVTAAQARTAYARVVGESAAHDFPLPRRVRVILASDDIIDLDREG